MRRQDGSDLPINETSMDRSSQLWSGLWPGKDGNTLKHKHRCVSAVLLQATEGNGSLGE